MYTDGSGYIDISVTYLPTHIFYNVILCHWLIHEHAPPLFPLIWYALSSLIHSLYLLSVSLPISPLFCHLLPPSSPSLNIFSLWCTAWLKRSLKIVRMKQVILHQCAQPKTELFFLLLLSSGGKKARLRLLVRSSYVCLRGRSGYSISGLPWNQLL